MHLLCDQNASLQFVETLVIFLIDISHKIHCKTFHDNTHNTKML